jgi:adenylate cyclase
MSVQPSNLSSSYALEVSDVPGDVRALRGDTLLAQSRNARVAFETRLAPVVYFPPEDVIVPLGEITVLKTFCPFKGTARYRDIILPDGPVPNAVWTYSNALPESVRIEGQLAFTPGVADQILTETGPIEQPGYASASGPVIDWLLREAGFIPTPEALTAALGEKLREQGVHVTRISVMIWSLHPLIAGKNYVWDLDAEEVSTFAPSYEIHDHPAFVNSPLRHVSDGLGGVRQRLGTDYAENSFPIMEDLRAQGATDYVAMPLPFSDGRMNVLSVTGDHPNGFSTANLGLIFECIFVISRFYEVFMQRENAQSLLETYVGKRTGARVLGGEIRRGDGDEIDAAIMFCDLRHSTRLEEELSKVVYLELLNHFFETTSSVVQDCGGEVLKFIGDAVLAVFPAGDNAKAACAKALASARGTIDALRSHSHCEGAVGIAFGRVTYGNVGSKERLDFTVIGHAANVAARLCDQGKHTGHAVVFTEEVLGDATDADDLGLLPLHNVGAPVHCYGM